MNFMENMKETLNEEFNESVTENGAVGYRTTGREILDFNFKIASYRDKKENEIIKDFERVFQDNKILAMQFLFFIRDREEGLGERRLFRIIIKHLGITEPEMVVKLIPVIAVYGRYDDLLIFFNTRLEDEVINYFAKTLIEDGKRYRENKSISLLAKWLPSINASKKQRKLALGIIDKLKVSKKEYRKMLSTFRKYIDVVERKMCANEWEKIDYGKVPSRANLNYNDAFLRHDEERRRAFLGNVQKGEKKIHASKLYPHDIVHKYTNGYSFIDNAKDDTLEELWKALPAKNIANTLVVADGSGSMTSHIGNTKISALDVANALAIYFAEHNKGEFKDKYITFSENPKFVDLSTCTTLHSKINKAFAYDEVANTNIEKVFDLILGTAKKYKMSQEEMPANILIISDMEFDSCACIGNTRGYWDFKKPNKKLFKVISERYEEAGYKLPRLVFWNVSSRTETIPVKENDLGVALVSGFSINIAEMVMSNNLKPLGALLEKLGTERYKKILEILAITVDEC